MDDKTQPMKPQPRKRRADESHARTITVQLNRWLFIVFILLVAFVTGLNTWGTFANRREADRAERIRLESRREDQIRDKEFKEKLDLAEQINKSSNKVATRADRQLAAVTKFQQCAFVLILGPDLQYDRALELINDCIEGAEFPPRYEESLMVPSVLETVKPKSESKRKSHKENSTDPKPDPKPEPEPKPEPIKSICLGDTGVCITNPDNWFPYSAVGFMGAVVSVPIIRSRRKR